MTLSKEHDWIVRYEIQIKIVGWLIKQLMQGINVNMEFSKQI
jgi:hypothetical protein